MLITAKLQDRQTICSHSALAGIQMATVKVGRYNKRDRVVTIVSARRTMDTRSSRRAVAIAAIQNSALANPNRLKDSIGPYVFDQGIEFGTRKQGEYIGQRMRRQMFDDAHAAALSISAA
jgi:hypothetical protein